MKLRRTLLLTTNVVSKCSYIPVLILFYAYPILSLSFIIYSFKLLIGFAFICLIFQYICGFVFVYIWDSVGIGVGWTVGHMTSIEMSLRRGFVVRVLGRVKKEGED